MRRRFLGGVHPASYKESTRRKPIMPLEESPKQVAIPLTMCTGGGAVPVVKPGDKVNVAVQRNGKDSYKEIEYPVTIGAR